MPVALLVQRLEALAQLVAPRAAHGELVRLAAVAHVPGHLELGLATERRADLVGQRVDARVLVAEDRALGVGAAVGGGQPQRTENARGARDEDPRHPELLRDRGRVQRPGAAEGQQGEAPRVDAALDGHHPQRAHHLGVGHAHDALRARADLEVERAGQPFDRRVRRVGVEGHVTGQRDVGAQMAQNEVRVGDRGLGPAAPVARRPRLGARAARTHAQGAARVAPGDRAAAGADGVDVDHGQRQRPAADLAGRRLAHAAVLDDAHVARGAAHVEAQQVGHPAALGEQRRGGRAAGGTAEHRERGVVGGGVQGRQAAAGLHDGRRGQPGVPRCVEQAAQVARQQRGEGGVDLGGRRSLELAEGPDDLVRERDVHPEALSERRPDRALVLGVAIAVQQADRDRLGLGARHRVDQRIEVA
jgi:hypothetical protein